MSENACLRCGHTWKQRKAARPINCPVCKSPKWDVPRPKEETDQEHFLRVQREGLDRRNSPGSKFLNPGAK